jgi:hypothetical protein
MASGMSGISSASMTRESPIWSSACPTRPSGIGMRMTSSAPKAFL